MCFYYVRLIEGSVYRQTVCSIPLIILKFLDREEIFDAHIHVSQNTHDYVRKYKKYFSKDVCIKNTVVTE